MCAYGRIRRLCIFFAANRDNKAKCSRLGDSEWQVEKSEVESFEEVKEHSLVNSTVGQIRRIYSDGSPHTVFRSALMEDDGKGQVSFRKAIWCRIYLKKVLFRLSWGSRSNLRSCSTDDWSISSHCASSRSHCSLSPSPKTCFSRIFSTWSCS